MAHFAQIDENNIVINVIVAEKSFVDTLDDNSKWIQTSYNTRGGIHYGQDGQPDGGPALRKNLAGIGHIYDPVRDAFYAPKPFPSWLLNEHSCVWEPPIPYPTNNIDGIDYVWDESKLSWVKIENNK